MPVISTVDPENVSRAALLSTLPLFAAVPSDLLRRTAGLLTERTFEKDAAIVTEGEPGDGLYIVTAGIAEVTAISAAGKILLGTVSPGEIFGEIALSLPGGSRRATVTAVTPLRTLALGRSDFLSLMDEVPQISGFLTQSTEIMLIAKVLKAASPFSRVDIGKLREIAGKVERLSAQAGEEIIREGERGDACYVIAAGEVEVGIGHGDSRRVVATLRDGALFGEAALLADTPRTATVRAVSVTELLAIRRPVAMEVLAGEESVRQAMTELFHLRVRPKAREGIVVFHRANDEGDTITTLKDSQNSRYYRLSAEGFYVWQQLDGNHTVRDILLACLLRFRRFSPQTVCGTIAGLIAAGFAEAGKFQPDVARLIGGGSGEKKMVRFLRTLVVKRFVFSSMDGMVTGVYKNLASHLMTPAANVFWGILAISGIASFTVAADLSGLSSLGDPKALSLFLLLFVLSAIVHEGAHACMAKKFGFAVDRGGVGWFWFLPVAFVDTSESWVGSRRERMLITAAGPYSTLLLASLAALLLRFDLPAEVGATLTFFAGTSYVLVLVNLNPLVEFDGYYLLSDYLEEPNLRVKGLQWLRSAGALVRQGKKVPPPPHKVKIYLVCSSLFIAAVLGAAVFFMAIFAAGR